MPGTIGYFFISHDASLQQTYASKLVNFIYVYFIEILINLVLSDTLLHRGRR